VQLSNERRRQVVDDEAKETTKKRARFKGGKPRPTGGRGGPDQTGEKHEEGRGGGGTNETKGLGRELGGEAFTVPTSGPREKLEKNRPPPPTPPPPKKDGGGGWTKEKQRGKQKRTYSDETQKNHRETSAAHQVTKAKKCPNVFKKRKMPTNVASEGGGRKRERRTSSQGGGTVTFFCGSHASAESRLEKKKTHQKQKGTFFGSYRLTWVG